MTLTDPRIFLVAGEPSGDTLGAGLLRALRAEVPGTVARGIGGPGMVEAGMDLVFPYDDLAIMGVVEILPKLAQLQRRWAEAAAAVEAFRPDVVVTIDSSGFNKGLAKRLIKARVPARRVHYVAPMVWAWRPGRAEGMAKLFDRLMTLFPFEPPYFEPFGLPTDCVGHPAVEARPGDGPGFRAGHAIPAEAPALALLPGSRRGEVKRLLPLMVETVRRIAPSLPGLHLICPTVPLVAPLLREALAGLDVTAVVVDRLGDKHDALAAADAALAASGTITLELALARVPMVVTYRVNALTGFIGRRLLKVRSASLPNLLAGRPFVPELLQDRATPDRLAAATLALLRDPDARQRQAQGFAEIAAALNPGTNTPSATAAKIVLEEAVRGRAAQTSPR
ncbi:MAG: lipid-A-disaccharide synthase [Alphaproteobacteria bacterium]|nr:lipid-A-disaccharide synthase [Alphaproteobacteria bacterium]MCB9930076.1 lipid-A-disaccharide synthase [Alphaproteobacteria bacterium]